MILSIPTTIERLPLVDSPPNESGNAWLCFGVIALAALAAGLIVSLRAWREPKPERAAMRAYRTLAWRLRIGPVGRWALRRLAQRSGVPLVALVLSEGAFDRARASHPPRGRVAAVLMRLRRRVFLDR